MPKGKTKAMKKNSRSSSLKIPENEIKTILFDEIVTPKHLDLGAYVKPKLRRMPTAGPQVNDIFHNRELLSKLMSFSDDYKIVAFKLLRQEFLDIFEKYPRLDPWISDEGFRFCFGC